MGEIIIGIGMVSGGMGVAVGISGYGMCCLFLRGVKCKMSGCMVTLWDVLLYIEFYCIL